MGNPFVHLDLATDDLEAAKKFYKAVFDWKLQDFPQLNWTGIDVGAGVGGGMGKKQNPSEPTAWTPYVQVDDVKKAIAKAQKAGANIVVPFMEVPGMGYLGVFTDPQGAMIGVWQGGGGNGGGQQAEQKGSGGSGDAGQASGQATQAAQQKPAKKSAAQGNGGAQKATQGNGGAQKATAQKTATQKSPAKASSATKPDTQKKGAPPSVQKAPAKKSAVQTASTKAPARGQQKPGKRK